MEWSPDERLAYKKGDIKMRIVDERLAELSTGTLRDHSELYDIIADLQDARAQLNEAIEVIKGMVYRADAMSKSADEHPEREHVQHRALGADRVAHAGREHLERIGGES